MTEGPTREETEQRLEAIFSSALEGEELEKMIASIPKRIEKFEGKWGGLIGWAEKKYGVPDESEDEPPTVEKPEAEDETVEEEVNNLRVENDLRELGVKIQYISCKLAIIML